MKTKEKIRRELKKLLSNKELTIDFNQFIEKNDEDAVDDAVYKTIAILKKCGFAFHLTVFRTKNGQKAIKINVESESSLHQVESMEYCDFEMLVESWAKPNNLKELVEALKDGVLFELGDDEELIFDFAVLVDEDRYVFLSKDCNKLLIVNKQGEVTEFVDLNSKNE